MKPVVFYIEINILMFSKFIYNIFILFNISPSKIVRDTKDLVKFCNFRFKNKCFDDSENSMQEHIHVIR